MLHEITHNFYGVRLFLVPAENLGLVFDRYLLVMLPIFNDGSEVREFIILPHQTIPVINGENLHAADLVLEWMNEPGRSEAEVLAARSFIATQATGELSANQNRFVAEVEAYGFTVDYGFVPAPGQVCPAINLGELDCALSIYAACEVDRSNNNNHLFARY